MRSFKRALLFLIPVTIVGPIYGARMASFQSGGPEGGEILALAFKPGNSTVALAGSGNNGVFQSTDDGATWNATNSNRYIEFCQGIVFDPANPTTAYAGGGNGGGGFNFERSTDSGKTWNFRGTTLASFVRSLVIDPVHTSNLLAGTDNGIYRTTDAGATWATSNTGLPTGQIPSLSIDPTNPSITLAALRLGAIFRTTDGGLTWKPVSGLPTSPDITALTFDPTATGRAYAGGDKFWRSTDHGATWLAISTSGFDYQTYQFAFPASHTIVAASDEYLRKSTDGGITWSSDNVNLSGRDVFVRNITVDPNNPSLMLIATDGSGVVRSTDGGASWSPASHGLVSNAEVDALALDPTNPPTVLAGSRFAGAWRTTDGGTSWNAVDEFVWSDTVAYAPLTPGRLIGTGRVVSFSTDGGTTWTTPGQNIESEIQSLAVSPVNPHWIYAGANQGAWKSTNGGDSWSQISTGLPTDSGSPDVFSVASDFASEDIAYAGVYTDTGESVLKTTDGGNHWALSETGLPADSVNTLTADPGTAGVVYAGTGRGLFKTVNGGGQWTAIGGVPAAFSNGVNSVAIAPANSKIIFVGTNGSGAFMSTDAGGQWTDISAGLPGAQYGLYVNALVSDAAGARIWAGTPAGVFQIVPAPLSTIGSPTPAHIGGRSGH